jgi:hypothetical protein
MSGVAVIFLSGCSDRVRLEGFKDSPSGKYRASVVALGALGRGYDELTPKDVDLWISDRGAKSDKPQLYHEHIELSLAGEVQWDLRWQSETSVTILLFDYGPLDRNYARYLGIKRRPLEGRTLTLAADKKSFVLVDKTWTQFEDLSKYMDIQHLDIQVGSETKTTNEMAEPSGPANVASPRR